ncbi:hypothetical protein K1T35_48360 (plasmid) [Pseudonocardia sp. DSM 110487]|uniref:hypothetical protein n=1 Tax=Pseudonocardia sp. DSM 110487 TaxID=2865833 RepID=UPI001C6A5785|nr:hypothetical protein [Pseudonocardia sp. DSM 110487]QYN41162.1 hypothetical protein K1T35_48360 [Pseudonocardia sp. DSM 110487]
MQSVYAAMESTGHHVVLAVVRLLEQVLGRRRPFRRAVVILVLVLAVLVAARFPASELLPLVAAP